VTRERDLDALHRAALAAADPARAVDRALRVEAAALGTPSRALSLAPGDRVWLVAFGKAAPGMARTALRLVGPRLAGGVVAHPHGAAGDEPWPAGVRAFEASHPLPDEGSLAAGEAALELLGGVAPGDVVLALVSGGGSALCEALVPGVTLEEHRRSTEELMHAGADIVELNLVRRALSRFKAGGLARAAGRARVVTLLLSDVVGDRLESIASGPTIETPARPDQGLAALERRGLASRHPAVARALAQPAPVASSERGERIVEVIASNRSAAEAVCAEARARGYQALLLTDRLQGEAREVGRLVGGLARGVVESALPLAPPCCIVLGGETTVTVRGSGSGGRNLELALGAALALDGCAGVAVLSFATDGMDGSSGAAGAIATGDTVARARALGLSPHAALATSDTAPFFRALGDLRVTGPSGTNVNDLVVILASAKS
jgi:hydroxypyruvate reductase